MSSQPLCIGIDVSSTQLDIAAAGEVHAPVRSIANQAQAITVWLRGLPPGCRIGMEATSTYHRQLAELAHACGHTVYVFNPALLKSYIRSLRSRGKTDALDARAIARYVLNEAAAHHPWQPPSTVQEQLHTLVGRRHQAVKQQAALRQSMTSLPGCAAQLDAALDALEGLVAAIDRQIERALATDAGLRQRRKLLRSVCGIGPLTSAMLTARLSYVPYANSDALVAGFGLDPRPNDSGNKKGQRALSKRGHSEGRRLLYMAAVSACKNPIWNRQRERFLQRGLSKTAATCIIARKLLRVAFAVWTSGKPYDPARLGTCKPS